MKSKFPVFIFSFLAVVSASAQSLYHVGEEVQESLPLKWVVGTSLTYDDNVNPGWGEEQDSMGVNPYVGLSFVSRTPQTTWDVYARLGLVYYFDAPDEMDDVSSQSRAGINLSHQFSERLRFSSRNFVSYEMEPDYSYGFASSRVQGEYFYWQSDNSIGFRWTERFGTYTGLRLSGVQYQDVENNDRFTWEVYEQLRYQLTQQTVITFDTRFAQTAGDGLSSDYGDQYYLLGAEHRFSPTTVGVVRAGLQLHDVDDGDDSSSSPYIEFALNSQINQQFKVRAYGRYGIEGYDTVRSFDGDTYEFDDRQVLRFGVSGDYAITPMFSIFSGVDYLPSTYSSGRNLAGGADAPELDTDIINAYVGLSIKFNEILTGTVSYNYSNSDSDFIYDDYDRNRISVGLSAEF